MSTDNYNLSLFRRDCHNLNPAFETLGLLPRNKLVIEKVQC
jgi:hypothetical protein